MKETSEILVEHYQKTYELTYDLWKERNRLFLLLLALIGAATLLSLRIPEAESLLVDFTAKLLGITETSRIVELRASFPFGMLETIVLLIVLYLMVSLHHRAIYILRNYAYLAMLEKEIRKQLSLKPESIAFTRESTFYWSSRGPLVHLVKWVYVVFLGLLLHTFLLARLRDDFLLGNTYLAILDLLIALTILTFFYAYGFASVKFDKKEAMLSND